MNALVAEGNHEGKDVETHMRMNPLKVHLNAIKVKTPTELMYVPMEENSIGSSGMLDTGDTHNFVASRLVAKFGLNLSKCSSRLKAVNSEAQPMTMILYSVSLKVGEWSGKVNFMVVPLDDFNTILDNEFFILAKAVLMSFVGGLLIMNEK